MNDIERYKSKVLYRSIVGRETAKELWKGVLDTICGEDSFGNRPCDNGSTCDRCSQRVYEDVYIDKLKTQAKEQQGVSTNLQGYLSTKLDSKDSMYAIYSINNEIDVAYFTKELLEGKTVYKMAKCKTVKSDKRKVTEGFNYADNSEYDLQVSDSIIIPEYVTSICEIREGKFKRFLRYTNK